MLCYSKGAGAVQYLQQAAASGNPAVKQDAVRALSAIASTGTSTDSKLASRALSNVFESTRNSVVQVVVSIEQSFKTGTGVVISPGGYILTTAHVVNGAHNSGITISTSPDKKYPARLIVMDEALDLAVVKVDGGNFAPAHLSDAELAVGSDIIGIAYAFGTTQEMAVVGHIVAVKPEEFLFDADVVSGASGGPILNSGGIVIGIITSRQENVSVAVRSGAIVAFLNQHQIPHGI